MMLSDESPQGEELPRETWPSVPSLPSLLGPTIPTIGRRFLIHSPTTIFKLGGKEGEGIMTALAHSILGSCVPRVISIVTIPGSAADNTSSALKSDQHGLMLARRPGTTLFELWPSLTPAQRDTVKENLCTLLVRMRAHPFVYHGRPSQKPYVLHSIYGEEKHACGTSRSEWDDSRVRAMQARAASASVESQRAASLERLQRSVAGASGWDRPVLAHLDLSDRNILADPDTLEVTGIIDWEMANIVPAYFEYVAARLSGGHEPAWRRELLGVLRSVLRRECDEAAAAAAAAELQGEEGSGAVSKGDCGYGRTLAAWDTIVDVERIAQGYDDECYWTFETGLPGEGR